MLKILVSACLYGGRIVRYDGGDVTETHPTFLKWKDEGRLVPICPDADFKVFAEANIDQAAAYLEELLAKAGEDA